MEKMKRLRRSFRREKRGIVFGRMVSGKGCSCLLLWGILLLSGCGIVLISLSCINFLC